MNQESRKRKGGTRCPQRVVMGPRPSALGQADPSYIPVFLIDLYV